MYLILLVKKQKFNVFLVFFLLCLKKIEYDNRKNLEEAMRKENLCYDQNKNKRDNMPNWKIKEVKVFNKKRKAQNFIKNLEIIIGVIKEVILRVINNRILLQ